jgi:hypothetical protein
MAVRIGFSIIVWLVASAAATAQGRRPEHERLAVMVGSWQTEVDVKATPTGPALTVKGIEECAWFANLHVVCRNESKMESGPYSSIRLLSYQASTKEYSVYTVDSLGLSTLAFGQVSGDVWTFTAEGQGMRSRLTLTMTPDGYTGVSEFATRNDRWSPLSSVKATRQKP